METQNEESINEHRPKSFALAGRARAEGEPTLVGRESTLAELTRCLGESHLVTVRGPAGGGKTRLLREWTRGLDARLLWTKAHREVAPSPFQMFNEPIATLERELSVRPDLASVLVHELGVELPLMQSLGVRGGRSSGLQRGLLVMFSLVLAVVGRDRSTILVLDDCQWADSLTLDFLRYWAESGHDVLVVALYRDEEVGDEHLLRTLCCKSIRLAPLTAEQAEQLLLSRQPNATRAARESVIEQAGGNPFVLLNGHRTGGDERARYLALSSLTRQTLAVACVLGVRFSADDLRGCLDTAPELAEALADGLIEGDGEGHYRFTHDRLRDAVLACQHADQLGDCHLRAARHLSQAGAEAFQVAFHFQAAGAVREGFRYARQAGLLAAERHDSNTAIFYLRAALAGCEGQSRAVREELLACLGDAQRLSGSYGEALDTFSRALDLAGDDTARARLMMSIGDVYFKQGQLPLARDSVERGLALLGEKLSRFALWDFVHQGFLQVARTYLPLPRGHREPGSGELLKVDLYNRLAYIRWFLDGPLPAISAHLRELNLAQLHPPNRTLARAQATHAIAMGAFALWPRALRFGALGEETARALGDVWGEGQAAHFHGAALLGASRLPEAHEVLRRSVLTLQRTGDRWEENGARYHLALTLYRLGQLDEAQSLARQTQQIGVEIQDRLAAGDNLFTWAKASGGEICPLLLEAEKRHAVPDIQRAAELLGAEALLELRQGYYTSARDLLRQAIELYRARRAQSMYSAPLPCWLVTVLRKGAQAQSDPAIRRSWASQARLVLKSALRLAGLYRNNLPHALREQALLYRFEGKHSEASRVLERSSVVARELGLMAEREAAERVALLWGGRDGFEATARHDWML